MERAVQNEPDRYFVSTDLCGTLDGSRIAVSWLQRLEAESQTEAVIVVPSEHHATFNEHIACATGNHRWVTAQAFRSPSVAGWAGGPALLFFPDRRTVARFEQSPLVCAICVVQGVSCDLVPWARAFEPEDLTTGCRYPRGPRLDPIVAAALRSLELTNGWNGLTSAHDIALTVRTLRLLHSNGVPYQGDDLEVWALARRWTPAAAERLAGYATKVLAGGLIPLRDLATPPRGALKRWRESAQADRRAPTVCDPARQN